MYIIIQNIIRLNCKKIKNTTNNIAKCIPLTKNEKKQKI